MVLYCNRPRDTQVRGYESCHDSSGHAKSKGAAEDAQEDTEGLQHGHGLEAVAVVSCGLVRHDGAEVRIEKKRWQLSERGSQYSGRGRASKQTLQPKTSNSRQQQLCLSALASVVRIFFTGYWSWAFLLGLACIKGSDVKHRRARLLS